MIQIAEHLVPGRTPLWDLCRQVGVDYAVGSLPFGRSGGQNAWDFTPMMLAKKEYEDAGFNLAVIESSPPMERIRLGLEGRDEEIEWFNTMLRNMGALDIPVLCYNFMAGVNWMRTSFTTPARGGAIVTSFDESELDGAPPALASPPSHDQMWENFHYFLERVLPVAEKANVKLALHPDDPPLPRVMGVNRIMGTVENFQRVIDMIPSDHNGITMCQGNFRLMTDDLPATIRHFGDQRKIFFVHFRDVRGDARNFVETFHDDGPTDMLECIRAYRDIKFTGVLRSDHVPTMATEVAEVAGYTTLGRLFAVGYIKGLREAVYGKAA